MVLRPEALASQRTNRLAKLEIVRSVPSAELEEALHPQVHSDEQSLHELSRVLKGMAVELTALSEDTREIVREEIKAAAAGILLEARQIARAEARPIETVAADREDVRSEKTISWPVILLAVAAAAILAFATTVAGAMGAIVAALIFAATSTVAMSRG